MSQKVGTPDERLHLFKQLGRAYELQGRLQRAQAAYEEMLAEARQAGDREAEWRALDRLASMNTDISFKAGEDDELLLGVRRRAEREGNLRESEASGKDPEQRPSGPDLISSQAYAEQALSLAHKLGRQEFVARSNLVLGYLGAWRSNFETATARFEHARPFFERAGDKTTEAECLGGVSSSLAMLGRPEEAARLGREAMRIGRERGHEVNVASNTIGTVFALIDLGEYGEALATVREGLAAARNLGHAPILFLNLWGSADVRRTILALGEARAAYEEMRGVITFPEYSGITAAKLCAVAALRENWAEARAQALRAREVWQWSVLPWSAVHYHHEVEALLRGGDEALAREDLNRFAARVRQNRRFQIAYLRSLATLRRWEDETLEAVECLREAEGRAKEIGLPGELWQILATLGELHEGRGERSEAGAAFAESARILQTLSDKIADPGLREGFLRALPVRGVLERRARSVGGSAGDGG